MLISDWSIKSSSTRIDRLIRSLSDSANLVDRLDAADASFVTVTQFFNTATRTGRLMLNTLLSKPLKARRNSRSSKPSCGSSRIAASPRQSGATTVCLLQSPMASTTCPSARHEDPGRPLCLGTNFTHVSGMYTGGSDGRERTKSEPEATAALVGGRQGANKSGAANFLGRTSLLLLKARMAHMRGLGSRESAKDYAISDVYGAFAQGLPAR
ncbi:recombinase family protein [Hoeflea sp.]|uniref:recombinase family protein n=1 Tax=Hoeflea sp. TaxID=1940281 RepID=UPI0037491148